jgi:hypothetical protein
MGYDELRKGCYRKFYLTFIFTYEIYTYNKTDMEHIKHSLLLMYSHTEIRKVCKSFCFVFYKHLNVFL